SNWGKHLSAICPTEYPKRGRMSFRTAIERKFLRNRFRREEPEIRAILKSGWHALRLWEGRGFNIPRPSRTQGATQGKRNEPPGLLSERFQGMVRYSLSVIWPREPRDSFAV